MLLRLVLLFLFVLSLSYGASIPTPVKSDTNRSIGSDDNVTQQEREDLKRTKKHRAEDINTTLDLLQGYDSVTAAGVIQSEPEQVDENLSVRDQNNSDLISPSTKLDDVSNLDIAKAKRKQRKVEREHKEEKEHKAHALVDTIVVKGSVLQGKIDQLTSEYVSFKLIYGEGSIRIDYSDIETLETEHEYHIYFDAKETIGKIVGIKDHAFLNVKHGDVEELITIAKIDRFIVSEREDASIENRIRNTFPYWSGNVDLGLEFEDGSNVKNKVKLAGHVERSQGINKTVFDVTYGYETTQTYDTTKVLNKHELYTFLEQHRRFSDKEFLFVEIGYDFDVPRFVDHRLYPSAGYGYRIQSTKKRWIQFKVGAGYVYETFLGGTDTNRSDSKNRYAAGMFGVDGEYEVSDLMILNRVLFGASLFYMPGVKNLNDNWLLRYSINASIPLSKTLSLRMIARQITDDNPAPEVGNNKFTFDMYISLRF